MTAAVADKGTTADQVVIVNHVSVVYGDTVALRDVSLSVERGERVLLDGPNGAGKTTLLRLIAGLLRPSRGAVLVAGRSPFDLEVRRQSGVMLHNPWLDPDLTVTETLEYFARLYGLGNIDDCIDELLDRLGMASRRHQLTRELSRGYQQRLSLARALLHSPRMLLLDEPDTGLDEASREVVRELLCGPDARCRTVVLSSHNRDFGRALADRSMTLQSGRIVDSHAGRTLEPAWAG